MPSLQTVEREVQQGVIENVTKDFKDEIHSGDIINMTYSCRVGFVIICLERERL